MVRKSDWSRLATLSWKDRLALAEAALELAFASLAIKILPFRRVVKTWPTGKNPPNDASCLEEIDRVTWAVNLLSRRLPWRIVCFQKGLAVHRLLRRRQINTLMHYGITQYPTLKAHVWVTYASSPIIGGTEAVGFTCIATFPTDQVSNVGTTDRKRAV